MEPRSTASGSSGSEPGTTAGSTPTPGIPASCRRATCRSRSRCDGGTTWTNDRHAAQRQPRPVDRAGQQQAHDRGERRRRQRLARRRPDLDRAGLRSRRSSITSPPRIISRIAICGAQQDNSTVCGSSRPGGGPDDGGMGGDGNARWYDAGGVRVGLHRGAPRRSGHHLSRAATAVPGPRRTRAPVSSATSPRGR